MKKCYSLLNNIKYNIYIYIIIRQNATVRELSLVLTVCQFCHFSIYISVRFIYISFTFHFALFFLFLLAKIRAMPFLPCHACHLWQVLDFKQIFLAKTLAKTCHTCHKNDKSLILKEFLFVKCGTSLLYK